MPLRLPRPPGSLAFFASNRSLARPALATAPLPAQADAARPARRCDYSSSSSAGRPSSRDGSPRVKQQPAAATAPRSPSPAPKPAHAPKLIAHSAPKAPQPELKRAFELPHVRKGVVGLDAFFAGPRPLLELPLPLGTRRSTSLASTDSAHVPGERADFLARSLEQDEDVLVVDQAEDGSPVGAPYLARVKPMDVLKTVEEELAAEEAEERALMQRVEMEHEREADEAEPYDAWLIGQQEVQPPNVARYLAVRPPFTAPPAPAPATLGAPQTRPDLAFLAPFNSTPAAPAPSSSATPFSPTFSSHFVDPLKPDEATAVADRFLSHANFLYRWHARNDFIDSAGESLRRAAAHYAGTPQLATKPAAASADGSIRMWREQDGWVDVPVGLGLAHGLGESVFLPAEMVDLDADEVVHIQLDSVKRKRRTKMKKHKYKKRRKAQRALRQRLGK
ncbi:hypothetical protein JCM10450v2_002680 [Rhodotorula kratochvilovae]